MKVKNKEWIVFKEKVYEAFMSMNEELDKFDIPQDNDDFEIKIDGCSVYPTFVNKNNMARVEYDFLLCNTKLRTLAISRINDSFRIEYSLKNTEIQNG
jgi:hypothetical protein